MDQHEKQNDGQVKVMCSRWKKYSLKSEYNQKVGDILIGEVLSKRNQFYNIKNKTKNLIQNSMDSTGIYFMNLECPVCWGLLDYDNNLVWNFCKTSFWALCLLLKLKNHPACPNWNKFLKKSDISSNFDWKNKINNLLTKANKWNSTKENKRISLCKTPSKSFRKDNIDLNDSPIRNKRVNFSGNREFSQITNNLTDQKPDLNYRESNWRGQKHHERGPSNRQDLQNFEIEAKENLNEYAKKLISETEKEWFKRYTEYLNAIEEFTKNKAQSVLTPLQNTTNLIKNVACPKNNVNTNQLSKCMKQEVIEIVDEDEKNDMIIKSQLKISYDNFINPSPKIVIVLNCPIQVEAILEQVVDKQWNLFLRQQEETKNDYKFNVKMKNNNFISMKKNDKWSTIKSNMERVCVASFSLKTDDISKAKGSLNFLILLEKLN